MIINKDILDMSKEQYRKSLDLDSYDMTDDGKIKLVPTEYLASQTKANLTSNINMLEEKLKMYKSEKVNIETTQAKYPKKKKKKKLKKEKNSILRMIFNNAETKSEEREAEAEEEYKDIKTKNGKKKKEVDPNDPLQSKYAQRFSPIISLLYESIDGYGEIIDDIESDLSSIGNAKTRYKSDQTGNLISAKNAELSAIKALGDLSKTISDLEYKKEKDSGKDAESNTDKTISALGIKFLKGNFDDDDDKDKKKKNKDKRKKAYSKFDDDDDDDEDDKILKEKKKNSDRELATEFAKSIFDKKSSIGLTPHEKHIAMEGKYTLVIVADSDDVENSWKFIALDKKGKEIKDFRDEYKDLIPKKKNVKLVFDLNKLKVTDKNTSRTYKLLLK